MKSVILIPYCPLPVNTGARVEMWKHMDLLREMGDCTILSAGGRPVGGGWTPAFKAEVERRGFKVVLREGTTASLTILQYMGMVYGGLAKLFRLEQVFGHSNPYHRFAFPPAWWSEQTRDADLVVINYSYWARLPVVCPKVVVLHDLLSDRMWGGSRAETRDLKTAELVVTISAEEDATLRSRGVSSTLWSPPVIPPVELDDSSCIGVVGSASALNREGLKWLSRGGDTVTIRVYGGLSDCADGTVFKKMGRYDDATQPYRECGVVLLPTALGTGVQIKAVEALAAGRCIVARRGAMRGLPVDGQAAWIEVDTPQQMVAEAWCLQGDGQARRELAASARRYYRSHLDATLIRSRLKNSWDVLRKKQNWLIKP